MYDESNHGKFEIPKPPGDPWKICLEPLLMEDKVKCEAWRDEVQNLLIFAGLFSAVVTAFVIQSCQDLQPVANNSAANLLLATLLNSSAIMIGSPVSNSSNTLSLSPAVSSSSIRVNICWLTSLILSLMTVLIGIVSLQWIREYQRYPTNISPKRIFAARNLRHEGLHSWFVPEMFAALPLLLQTALALFLVGLTDFLVHLNIIVAVPAVVLTAAILTFLLVTTIAPALQGLWMLNLTPAVTSIPIQCPYKSPQSWAFFRLISSRFLPIYLIATYKILCSAILMTPARLALLNSWTTKYGQKLRSYLCISPNLRHLRVLRSWSSFDGFWLDGRQRLYTKSSDDNTYITRMTEKIDCDAARGIAHVIDGRAQDETIAISVYCCFQQLPISVIGDDVFKIMTLRLPEWMTVAQARRRCGLLANQNVDMVRVENEMFLLGRLPQTVITHPLHIFRKRQLHLFVRFISYILVDACGTQPCENMHWPTQRVQCEQKRLSFGKLFIPTCLKSVRGFGSLPENISSDLAENLIDIFYNAIKKAIAIGNEDYRSHTCFNEETLGDFAQLMRVVTMSTTYSSARLTSASAQKHVSQLADVLNILNREATKRSRTSRRCVVYLSILYVSRFQWSDWAPIQRTSRDLSTAFQDLVESLHTLGLTTFNFALERTLYQKQCKDLAREVLASVQPGHLLQQPQCSRGVGDLVVDAEESSNNTTYSVGESLGTNLEEAAAPQFFVGQTGAPSSPEPALLREDSGGLTRVPVASSQIIRTWPFIADDNSFETVTRFSVHR